MKKQKAFLLSVTIMNDALSKEKNITKAIKDCLKLKDIKKEIIKAAIK